MRILKIAAKIILIITVVIALTEVTLRLTSWEKLQKWSECQYQADPVLGYRYKVNSAGAVNSIAYNRHYQINSHGFPGQEFSTTKGKGIYRIAIAGNSEESGLYTNGPINYINMLDSLFKENGRKVEVINLGIDGHFRSIKNINLLKGECAGYQPDLVLLKNTDFPLNDAPHYRTTYKGILINYTEDRAGNLDSAKAYVDHELSCKDFRLYLYDYSYIYRYLAKIYLDQYQKSKIWEWLGRPFFKEPNKMECYARHLIFWPKYVFEPKEYSVRESFQILRNLDSTLLERKTKLILYNTYAFENSEKARLSYAENNINYLPLDVIPKEEYSFGKLDGHSSQEGHKAIALALYRALKDSISN